MNLLDVYMMYNAMGLHFSSESYDFFKYGGRTRVTTVPVEYKWQFEAMAKKYTKLELMFHMFNVYKDNGFKRVSPILMNRCVHKKSQNDTIQNTYNMIVNEIVSIIETNTLSKQGDLYPKLYEDYRDGEVMLETLIVANIKLKNILKLENSRDIIVWPNELKLLNDKVTPFVRCFFDCDKILSDISHSVRVK